MQKELSYVLMDPSKNITILVETDIPLNDQVKVAEVLLKKEKTAEQVGFITLKNDNIYLRMAGNEFCGNATMSAAAYYVKEKDLKSANVKVNVSNQLVNVQIDYITDDVWQGIVDMPKAIKVIDIKFPNNEILPVVFFEGIAHIIYKSNINRASAEALIKEWCSFLNVEALGIMFVDDYFTKVTPLVYVKAVDTLYWENACASGSSAVGVWLSKKENKEVKVSLTQAGGDVLEVSVDKNGNIKLKGVVSYISKSCFSM